MNQRLFGYLAVALFFLGCSADGTTTTDNTQTPQESDALASADDQTDVALPSSPDKKQDAVPALPLDQEANAGQVAEHTEESVVQDSQHTVIGTDPVEADQFTVEAKPTKEELMDEARTAFQNDEVDRGIELVNQAHQSDPSDRQLIVGLANLHIQRGLQLAAENREQSQTNILASARLMRQLRDDGEDITPAERQLLIVAMYKEAGVHASAGKSSEAMSSLREAIDAGLDNVALLEIDDDLASLRDEDGFATMLDQMRIAAAERQRAEIERYRQEIKESLASNESFPFTFALPNLEGETVSKDDFKGKILIVDIWGTWCPPCREEVPHFEKLYTTYGDQLQVVGINYEHVPQEAWVDTIAAFVAEKGLTYPCLIGDDATQQLVPNLTGFPTTLLIDGDGKVRLKVVGYHSYEKLEIIVKELMKEAAEGKI